MSTKAPHPIHWLTRYATYFCAVYVSIAAYRYIGDGVRGLHPDTFWAPHLSETAMATALIAFASVFGLLSYFLIRRLTLEGDRLLMGPWAPRPGSC